MLPHERLERELAEWVGASSGNLVVACSSGTAALHLALESLHLPQGSEVIVPDYTMIACARAVTLAGLVPVFVDCGDDLLIDPKLVASAVSKNTAAVMVVHVYGRRVDITGLRRQIPYSDCLSFVEDMSEAHGLEVHHKTDAACYSFYRNKVVAGEEGGCVVYHDALPSTAMRARQLRCLGFTETHDYQHVPRGHNYRMSGVHASLISKSLKDVQRHLSLRKMAEERYDRVCPEEWKMPERDSVWVYDLRIRGMTARQQTEVVAELKRNGVEARHGFKPMSVQQEYEKCRTVSVGKARVLANEVIYLPVLNRLGDPITADECDRTMNVIRSALE